MENGFARWFVSLLLLSSCFYGDTQVCQESDLSGDDTSLVLPSDEPERLVSMTGELHLRVLNKDPEDSKSDTFDCWILKMNPASFEIACSTPVFAAFQSSESIRSCENCTELELTGDYDKLWLREHLVPDHKTLCDFDRVKTSKIDDCKLPRIELIRSNLQSSILENFHAGKNRKDFRGQALGQTVTLSGYLWHAHTIHHHTPVMMDTDPWLK